MKPNTGKSGHIQIGSLEKSLLRDEEEALAQIKPQNTSLAADAAGTGHSYTGDADAKRKNFDQKIYMFPESYNQLRRELVTHWPNSIWPHVSWLMAFDAPNFVEKMNFFLDMKVQFDSQKVEAICQTFLDALILKRKILTEAANVGHHNSSN